MSEILCLSLSTMTAVDPPSASVLCLGNFDGVHLAHRSLIQKAVAFRDENQKESSVSIFCFTEPPSLLLDPKASPMLLCTVQDKLRAFADCGVEFVFLGDFSSLRNLSPSEFADRILLSACHASALACGFNYRFGKNAAGTPRTLESLLEIPLILQDEVMIDGETVSSTRIRRLLKEGKTEDANRLLGRPFSFTSEVLHGKALGRVMGFPTVNQLFPDGLLIPCHGVYASRVLVEGKSYHAISNIGVHPTVDQNAVLNCETHILQFDGDLYGREITVELLSHIRNEEAFASLDELIARIREDIVAAEHYFQNR